MRLLVRGMVEGDARACLSNTFGYSESRLRNSNKGGDLDVR